MPTLTKILIDITIVITIVAGICLVLYGLFLIFLSACPHDSDEDYLRRGLICLVLGFLLIGIGVLGFFLI